MTVDFEIAVINALKEIFSDTIIRACRFHLAQAWQRKFRELGFQKQYNSRTGPIVLFLKSIFGIPCLPVEEVSEFFKEELSKCAPEELKPFLKYLENQYMMPNFKFPPHLWAGVGHSSLKFTTNGCENFHRHLSSWFSSHKPNIFTFLENISMINVVYEVKSRSQKQTPTDENAQFIQQLWKEVQTKNISISKFISLVSSNAQPISKTKSKTKARRSARVIKMIKQKFAKKVQLMFKK